MTVQTITTGSEFNAELAIASYILKKSAQARARALATKFGAEYPIVQDTATGMFYVMPPVVAEVEAPVVPEPKGCPANWAEVEAARLITLLGDDVDKLEVVSLPKQYAIKVDGVSVSRLYRREWAEKVLAEIANLKG